MAYYDGMKQYASGIAAIDSSGNSISYNELDTLCRKIGCIVPKRALVFSFCENSVGALIGYVAFLYHHVVPVLLDKHLEKGLRENLLELYCPDYLFFPEKMTAEFSEGEIVWQEYGYCLMKNPGAREHVLFEELGLLLSTSGSTGSPKLVRQSYANIQANAESIAAYLKLTDKERPITTLPMNYTYGLSIINSHLLVGATILMTDFTLMQREFWEFFKEKKATSFGGVPYTYEMLKKLRFFKMELPSLKTMTQAGGKLAPELHKEFAEYARENGRKFVVMYGQTEATARMAYLPAEKALEKYGSMGIAIPGGRLELIDLQGQNITEPDVVGELVYYGPNVTLGYAQCMDDLALGDERHGRLETGDMAKRDAEGYYYIVGRKKRFLKIFGNRVNLDETERMVKSYFTDCDCACGGRDDQLFVFVTADSDRIREDILHFLTEKTGLHASAFQVKYIAAIPKNEAGKTLYSKLEEYYK